jgi:hypothetical protein
MTIVLRPQERTLIDTEIEGFSKRLITQVERAACGFSPVCGRKTGVKIESKRLHRRYDN